MELEKSKSNSYSPLMFFFVVLFVLTILSSNKGIAHAAKPTENSNTDYTLQLTSKELAQIKSHGPWPPVRSLDVSNRFSGNPDAIKFGKALFSSTALSLDNNMSCTSCHAEESAFASGKFIAQNPKVLDRDTQSLLNVKFNRWFGWDGSNDSLWSQSFRAITNKKEMNLPVERIKSAIDKAELGKTYRELFGDISNHSHNLVLVNIGKALSAFQETLVTKKTSFDHFRDALEKEDWAAAASYSPSAQRGLSLFIGRANCSFCHSGPLFSNSEFHDAGVPYFIKPGVVDKGRYQGIINLKKSPFTLASKFNDDVNKSGAWAVNNVATLHSNFGIFRVPGLRGLTKTAPYMHNGSLVNLEAVIEHYNNINIERLHADGEAILRPLNLTKQEAGDLLAFLKSLSD